VAELWGQFGNQWERLRWARLRAGYERAKDAADSLNIKPVTYRTYEIGKADGGRAPTLSDLQRMCRKFKVSWIWVATGEGSPDEGVTPDERMKALAQKMGEVPAEKQDDALAAMMGMLDGFSRKAG
jgi:transcriptional regulator with XRE-family HTH domain